MTALVRAIPGYVVAIAVWFFGQSSDGTRPAWHALLEGRALLFTVLVLVAVLVGGVAELVPTIFVRRAVPTTAAGQAPYSPLELEGRDNDAILKGLIDKIEAPRK
jgi:hypothetical protein